MPSFIPFSLFSLSGKVYKCEVMPKIYKEYGETRGEKGLTVKGGKK